MLNEIFPNEQPRALQHMLERAEADGPAALPRRSFLKIVGIGGLALGAFPHLALAQEANGAAAAPLKPTQQPSAFVQIAPNGEVTVTINRLEFGQGVQTGLPMILAEELDADWSLVRSRNGSNDAAYMDPAFGIHLTGGSNSIKNSYTQYRELGARARAMLLSAAAARWNVDVASLSTQAGMVLGPAGRKASYGELAEAAMAMPVPEQITLKDPKDFRIIGQPIRNIEVPRIVTGQPIFGIDVSVPGMLYAVFQKCDVHGGTLVRSNVAELRKLPGVRAAFEVKGGHDLHGLLDGVAVVADSWWQANRARQQLEATWDEGDIGGQNSTDFAATARRVLASLRIFPMKVEYASTSFYS